MSTASGWLASKPMPDVETFLILTGPKSSSTGDANVQLTSARTFDVGGRLSRYWLVRRAVWESGGQG
jgi:hypothetical protein